MKTGGLKSARRWSALLVLLAVYSIKAIAIELADVGEAAPGTIEIRGVGAGEFDPRAWQSNDLHFVPDARHPLLAPREGAFRNIYAPSIVETKDGWRIFYGGWDGVDSGNDRIYTATTRDFLTFDDRHTVIEHGTFQHVCNVSAIARDDGSFDLMCTAYPTANGTNKPAFFHLTDLSKAHVASERDLIAMAGYDKFQSADINGMNVILRENDQYRLYFASFTDFRSVYRASSRDGRNFTFDGIAVRRGLGPNDVKKFRAGEKDWYIMGLHHNGPDLFYALSNDGLHFQPPRKLFAHRDEADRYIVAIGFVTRGNKLLGVLYGAGAKPSLDQNRIFARWLQPHVVVTKKNGEKLEATESLGPDRAAIRSSEPISGTLQVATETLSVELKPGRSYQLK
jgi:hypothetical protein